MPELFATQLRTVRVVTLVPSTSVVRTAGTVQVAASSGGGASVSDAVYGAGWNGDTTTAPSKNAVYDKIETLSAGGVTSVDGNTGAVTAAQLLTSIKTVDGVGSGLDADLLDGSSSAAFEVAGAAAAAQAAAIAASQPLDSDLTAIAALTTTSYGRAFLALADAVAGRTALGLGTAATTAASAYEVAGAAAAAYSAAIAASQPLDADLTSIAALSTTSFGRSFLALADAAAARTLTGAAPLASPTFTGTVTIPSGASITAPTGLVKGDVGLGNVDNTADTAKPVSTAQQTALDLKQTLDADLTTIAGLTATTDNFLQAKSSAWASRTPAQVGVDIGTAHHLRGTIAAIPAATSANAGYLYATSDTLAVYESTGSAWVKIADIANLPRFGGVTTYGHSYTQTSGGKPILATGGDTFGNFTHRIAALLNISADEVNLNGRSGAQAAQASAGDSTDNQGTGAVFRHIHPNHWYAGNPGLSNASSRSWPGLFMFCYGINEIGRCYSDGVGHCLTAYTHGIRAVTSRVMASQLYNAGVALDSTIALTTGFGTTTTDTGYTGGAYRKSTANSDVFTITVPADFLGGTIAVCLVGGTNTQTYANVISSTSTTSITLTDLLGTSAHTAIANGDVIIIDSEHMLVTAGGGTTSLTVPRGVNSTTAATHLASAVVRLAATTAKVTWSGTATGATGTTTTAGQGAAGAALGIRSTVPVVKRFVLTAADAGATIIGTVSGITTSSTEFVGLDSWWVEDPAPPTVLLVNQPNGLFGANLPGSGWTRSIASSYNGVLSTIAAEFAFGNVTVIDIATEFDALFYATIQTAFTSAVTTNVHITPSVAATNLIGKGSVIRVESASGVATEEMLVTAITKTSDTDWSLTVTRGYNGTTAVGHNSTSFAVYGTRAWSSDRIHPADHGHVLYTKFIFNALTTLTQTADQRANSGGLVVRRYPRLPEGGYLPGAIGGTGTKAAATIGTLYTFPILLQEMATLTQLSANVTAAANASGLLRFGVWTDGQGFPGSLLLDSRVYVGADLTQGSTGERTATVFQPLKPGYYWIGVAMQGTGTMSTMRTVAATPENGYPLQSVAAGVVSANTGTAAAQIAGYTVGGVTGALSSFTGMTSAVDSVTGCITTWAKFSVPIRD